MEHKHSFSVDTSCDCGVMLSEYTQTLAKQNTVIIAALKTLEEDIENHDGFGVVKTIVVLEKIRAILTAIERVNK